MQPIQLKIFPVVLLVIGLTGCQSNSVKDIDGNKYRTIKIGTQVWMSQNLKTTRYNDGTAIPLVIKYDDWAALTTPAYCWYNNDSVNKEVYGALYNWYAVNTKKLCPEGWHVPTDEEWNELRTNLGDIGNAGKALKESGTIHWKSPNSDASNTSGFTALPGGYRDYKGPFNLLRTDGYWWSSTESHWWSSPESSPTISFYRNLRYDDHDLYRNVCDKSFGFCVRCLMDQ
jgi:uncharacterized protein (TIGR02145 family)